MTFIELPTQPKINPEHYSLQSPSAKTQSET